jgi:curved DNA-binding protein CbpA
VWDVGCGLSAPCNQQPTTNNQQPTNTGGFVLTHYLTLGLLPDTSDEDIRTSYLQLVKKYTPERDPVRFQQITEAYEAIRDERNRVRGKIFGGLMVRDYESALLALARSREIGRRRVGLDELFQAEKEF